MEINEVIKRIKGVYQKYISNENVKEILIELSDIFHLELDLEDLESYEIEEFNIDSLAVFISDNRYGEEIEGRVGSGKYFNEEMELPINKPNDFFIYNLITDGISHKERLLNIKTNESELEILTIDGETHALSFSKNKFLNGSPIIQLTYYTLEQKTDEQGNILKTYESILTKTYSDGGDKFDGPYESLYNYDLEKERATGDYTDICTYTVKNRVIYNVFNNKKKGSYTRLYATCIESLDCEIEYLVPEVLEIEKCKEAYDPDNKSLMIFEAIIEKNNFRVSIYKDDIGITLRYLEVTGNGLAFIHRKDFELPSISPGTITLEEIDMLIMNIPLLLNPEFAKVIIEELNNFKKAIQKKYGEKDINTQRITNPKYYLDLSLFDIEELVYDRIDDYLNLLHQEYLRTTNQTTIEPKTIKFNKKAE